MFRIPVRWIPVLLVLFLFPVASRPETSPASASPRSSSVSAAPERFPRALLLALAQFETTPAGEVLPNPKAARLEILVRQAGTWMVYEIEDPKSNVFHKAMAWDPGAGSGILTLGGTQARLVLWRCGAVGWESEVVWEADFGGKFSRMRDAESVDFEGTGATTLAVGTHDQGVVATIRPRVGGGFDVAELDRSPDTFVHEIEIGDVDGDGRPEIYATPSAPNRLDGTDQPGSVRRYVPDGKGEIAVVAELGDRHAKEILVEDVDGDGRPELYVSVEDVGADLPEVEIRRYDAGTDPKGGQVVARIPDLLCRFLTAGDLDGDGRKEIVAAAYKSGLWLLRPGREPSAPWTRSLIDSASSGFEHAALLTDLDGDGRDELYVASDTHGEVRRYLFREGRFDREVILRREIPDSVFTWNLAPVPVELVTGSR